LLAVGSILHFARAGDVVWGSGVNGKIAAARHAVTDLDVRAVRGPRTREFLIARGVTVPPVFGDPALLLPLLDPRLRQWRNATMHELTEVPNLNDAAAWRGRPHVVDPRGGLTGCLRRIARSAFVVGSSLHAIIVAESLGVPARAVVSGEEDRWKYDDYFEGTGREGVALASSPEEAREMGGAPALNWSPDPLIGAFPADLWVSTPEAGVHRRLKRRLVLASPR
jgi:pyruvyltransferase